MFAPRLAQRLTAAFTLVPFLLGQPAALLTQALRPADPQRWLPAPGQRDEIPLVPWPQSLELLGVIDGARRTLPPHEAPDAPRTWSGQPGISHHDAVLLQERVVTNLERIEPLLNEMHAITREATGAPPDALPGLMARLQEQSARIAGLAEFGRNGIHPLRGSGGYFVFAFDRTRPPTAFHEVDVLQTPSRFDLEGITFDSPHDIDVARRETRDAFERIPRWRIEAASRLERLRLEAEPTRGLREMEALLTEIRTAARIVADSDVPSSTRIPLAMHLETLEARLPLVTTRTDLPAPNAVLPGGLDGGLLWLEPRDPSAPAILFEVPDHVPLVLFSTGAADVGDLTGVAAYVTRIDLVLEQVHAERERLLVTAVRLQGDETD